MLEKVNFLFKFCLTRVLFLALPLFLLGGCVSWVLESDYDKSEIIFQTLNLFNQRKSSSAVSEKWKGDWIFRRARLELIDAELRSTKPDVVLLQEMLSKKGSRSDADDRILSKGGLFGYEWQVEPVKEFADTGEEQSHGLAVGLPLRIDREALFASTIWKIGSDGFLTFSYVKTSDQPLAVFNVQMPSGETGVYLWYNFLIDRVNEVLSALKLCRNRLVIGGYLPGNFLSNHYSHFIENLEIKNTGNGYCAVASDCFTGTPINEIFMSISLNKQPAHFDKIFVHKTAFVTGGNVTLDNGKQTTTFKRYGITKLWPSQRFGWLTSVRFAKCPN